MGIPFEPTTGSPTIPNMGESKGGSPIRIRKRRNGSTGDTESTARPNADSNDGTDGSSGIPDESPTAAFSTDGARIPKPRVPRRKNLKVQSDFLTRALVEHSEVFALARNNPRWILQTKEAHALSASYADVINKSNIQLKEMGPIAAAFSALVLTYTIIAPRYATDPFMTPTIQGVVGNVIQRSQRMRANRGTFATNPTGFPNYGEQPPEPVQPIYGNGSVPFADKMAAPPAYPPQEGYE
jgi:hypothetical protein